MAADRDTIARRKKQQADWARQWRLDNPDKAKNKDKQRNIRKRQWEHDHPEEAKVLRQQNYKKNKKRILAQQRVYSAANAERRREYHARWRENKKEAQVERVRQWRLDNPERAKEHDRATSHRRRCAIGIFTATDIARIRRLQRDRCAYCRRPLKGGGEVDHIEALSKGGTNWPSNLQLACKSCNCSKRTRDAADFARSLGKLL